MLSFINENKFSLEDEEEEKKFIKKQKPLLFSTSIIGILGQLESYEKVKIHQSAPMIRKKQHVEIQEHTKLKLN